MDNDFEINKEIEKLTHQINDNRKNAELYYLRANTKGQLRKFSEALEDYDEAIRLKSDFADAYYFRANTNSQLRKFPEALQDYDKAIDLKTQYLAKAYYFKANAKGQLGKFLESLEDYDEAIRLEPGFADAYYSRATAKGQLGRFSESLEDYDKTIKLKPDFADAYYYRANTESQLGKFPEALEDYDEAISLKPDYTDAYYFRANIKGRLGKFPEALEDYDEAIRLKPGYTKAYCFRANTKSQLGKFSEALQDHDEAIRLKPDFADAYFFRANTKGQMKQFPEALQDYDKAINFKTQHLVDAYYFRANVKSLLRKFSEALQDYDEVIILKPGFADAYYYRANIKGQLGKFDGALEDYDEAIILKRDFAVAYYFRGNIYSQKENISKADEDYEECIKIFIKENKEFIEILPLFRDDQIENMLCLFFKNNEACEFYKIIGSEGRNNEKRYRNIYVYMWKIFRKLIIEQNNSQEYAHYTRKNTATKLIIEKSKFWLSPIITTNDSKEGKTLFESLGISEQIYEEQKDLQAFIGCFTFNSNNLNQYRLYGKENLEEGTGISLVLNNDFFASPSIYGNIAWPAYYSKDESVVESEKENVRYPLFRCIYLVLNGNKMSIDVSGKDSTDYLKKLKIQNVNLQKKIEKICKSIDKKNLNGIIKDFKLIRDQIDEISGFKDDIQRLLQKIKSEINKKGLKNEIIRNLLLPIRFLVKDAAFKEEQECRIICVKDVDADARKSENKREIKFTDEYSQMHVEYRKMTDECLEKVIFGPKARGFNVFKEALKHEKIECECEESGLPLA
jgi:tetratricopeptide (TPR) repeat protein